MKIRSNATFGYIEDINDENQEEDPPFDAKALVGVVTEALADKEREIQMYLALRRDSDAQQVGAECCKAQSEEKSKRTTRLVGNDGEKLQVPGFMDLLEDLPEEFTFSEPYNGAKYRLAEATDFSDERRVPIGGRRPFARFIGRKVRRYFESTNPKQREDMTPVEGVVER